ncbi:MULTISPECIES: enoyl-CoA hydratase/isomerase family protein [unclassified Ruegeria]|uniref:enoyl-CoA hydratase/isomerase family protein n=1 Tax=unclassified Ruegeria TaxID=2625375 RepID=UPI0014876AB7|nr:MULTISPECIES: enoyl-CoA hydratase/isomerase family protein [unclassified Ruegeria]
MTEFLQSRDLGGGVMALTLARGPVNALDPDFLYGFVDALNEFAAREDVRAVVLDSACKVFSAGLDLKDAMDLDREAQNGLVDALNHAFLTQFCFPKPLVSAVNGAAIAGGFFFVLAADWRVAGPKASFGLAEIRVGVDLPIGPLEIARATLEPNTLRRFLLTGQPIHAEDAAAQGVVDELVEVETLLDAAQSKAQELARLPALTYGRVKRQLRAPAIEVIEAEMKRLAGDTDRSWFNEETRDAMQRMLA